MDLNKIKLINQEELQRRLKQSGFEEVAKILEDKNIDGRTLLELKEFEIFKWRLNQYEKRNLWNCIKQIKDNPAILITSDKPMVRNKQFQVKEKAIENTEENKVFKNKLQGLLGSTEYNVGNRSTIPKAGKNKPLPTLQNENKGLNKPLPTLQNESKGSNKPLPTLKNESKSWNRPLPSSQNESKNWNKPLPPLQNERKNWNKPLPTVQNESKGSNKPLPTLQNESKGTNKPLPPPPPPTPPPRNDDVKNTNITIIRPAFPLPMPTEPESSDYLPMLAPPRVKEQENNVDYYLSPIEVSAPSKKKSPNLPKKLVPNEMITKPTTSSSFTKEQPSLPDEDTEETYENLDTYELSPPVDDNKRSNNKPLSLRGNSPLKIGPHQDTRDYKQSPADSSNRNSSSQKTPIKDLGGHALVIDDNVQEKKIPFFSQKLNIFKMRNKSKNLYENFDIQGASHEPKEIPIKNRPLPEIPSSSSPTTRPKTLFSRPFPPPRDISPDSSGLDNYVELINNFRTPEKPPSPEEMEESDDENQIYENTSKIQEADNEELIYENSSKTQSQNEEEEIYENTENIKEPNPPTITQTKKILVGNMLNQVLPKDFKLKPLTDDTANSKSSADQDYQKSSVQNLASLLSQQLMERIKKQQQQQEQIAESESDSEFDDDEVPDDQIYGNIPNDDQSSHPPVSDDQIALSDSEDKKVPIYKRKLPEIPKVNVSLNNNLAKKSPSPPPPLTKRDRDMKGERPLNRNSTLGVPRPVYSSYEDHTMKKVEAGSSKEGNKDGMDNIFNVTEEPFYRNTTRKGAKILLATSANGTFLIRPSRTYFLVLTIKHDNKIYNFGIERTPNNKLRLNTEGNIKPPEFSTLLEFVTYFIKEPVTFENGDELTEIFLKTHLPPDLSK